MALQRLDRAGRAAAAVTVDRGCRSSRRSTAPSGSAPPTATIAPTMPERLPPAKPPAPDRTPHRHTDTYAGSRATSPPSGRRSRTPADQDDLGHQRHGTGERLPKYSCGHPELAAHVGDIGTSHPSR